MSSENATKKIDGGAENLPAACRRVYMATLSLPVGPFLAAEATGELWERILRILAPVFAPASCNQLHAAGASRRGDAGCCYYYYIAPRCSLARIRRTLCVGVAPAA